MSDAFTINGVIVAQRDIQGIASNLNFGYETQIQKNLSSASRML